MSALPTMAGAVLLTPWFVGLLGKLGKVLPLPLRFAVRDGARQRGRTSPAVAAVMATVAGVVALAIGAASDAQQARAEWTPLAPQGTGVLLTVDRDPAIWASLRETLHAQLPHAEVVPVRGVVPGLVAADGTSTEIIACAVGAQWGTAGCPLLNRSGTSLGTEILVGEDALDLVEFPRPAEQLPAARAALRAGGVVVFSDEPLSTDRIDALRVTVNADRAAPKRGERVTLRAAGLAYGGTHGPVAMVVSERAAAELRLRIDTTALAVRGTAISAAAEDAVNEAARAVSPNAGFAVERGYTDDGTRIALLLLGVVGGVLVLGAAVTATALALSDARPDLATLSAVGASPRVRRSIAASYAAMIGLLGALIGAAVGLVPGIAVAFPLTSSSWTDGQSADMNGAQLPSVFIEVPWLLIGWIVVAVPLIAAVTVALTTRSRLPMVRRIP
jgi:putative ABC transport system permease protein